MHEEQNWNLEFQLMPLFLPYYHDLPVVSQVEKSHLQLSHLPRPGFKPGQWLERASSQWHCLRPQVRPETEWDKVLDRSAMG